MAVDTKNASSCVTYEEAKQHLRVDHDFEKELIMSLCKACTEMAEHEMQRPILSRDAQTGIADDIAEVPAAVKTYVLLHVATLYENRASGLDKELKPSPFLKFLLDPYRTWE